MKIIYTGLLGLLFLSAQAQGTWTQKANFGGTARCASTFISVGTKGYLGLGGDISGAGTQYSDWWAYNPTTDVWTQKASFTGTARHGASAFAIGGKAYVGNGIAGTTYVKDFFAYDTLANSWSTIASFGGSAVGYSVSFTISGMGYVGTGYDNSSTYRNDFWQYNPTGNTWTQKANFAGGARDGAGGFAIGSKGYIGAGENGTYKNDLWEYNSANDTWTQKSSFTGAGRMFPIGFALSGKGYFCIGTTGQWTYATDCYTYNPSSDTWSQVANFTGAGRYQPVGGAIGNYGYLGTGADVVASTNKNDFWKFSSAQPCTVADISTGLTASYMFNSNADDTTGHGYTGTTHNVTLTSDRFSTTNSAYSFNGSTSYIDVPNSTNINFANGISFSAWIMPTALTNASVVDAMSGSGNGFRTNTRDNSSPSPIFWSCSGNYNVGITAVSNSQYAIGTWYNITGTWGTDDSVRVYFNGVLQQTQHAPYNYTNTNPIYIGRGRQSSTYEFFAGKIDDIKIYNRALTGCDVDSIFNLPNTNTTGVEQVQQEIGISVYPNPSSDKVTLSISDLPARVSIFNSLGQEIVSFNAVSKTNELDLNGYMAGFYFVRVTTAKGTAERKIIRTR